MLKLLKKRWYFIVVILIIAGFIFYKQQTGKTAASQEKPYTVKKQNLKETLSISGDIDADEHVTLRFQSSGRLAWVGVKEGDYVKKYQGLASLDQRELEKNLKKYLNTYLSERWDYDQTKEDKDFKNIGGLSEDARRAALRVLDKAQFDLNNAVIDVELKDIALQYAYLYTPIEGIVVSVGSPYAGVNITPTQAEFEIINPKSIYFSATADQTDVINLRQGMKADITLDPYTDKTISGTISTISFVPKTGETGTVYQVKMSLDTDNENYRYRYGMTGDAEFILREKQNVLAIPTSYIKTEKGKKYVLKKVNGAPVKTYIKTGEELDSATEILNGLKDGDIIY